EGVFRTSDGGQTWKPVHNADIPLLLPAVSSSILLAAHHNASTGSSAVYALLTCQSEGILGCTKPISVFRSTDQGDSWKELDTFPEAGFNPSSMVVDPKDPNVLFLTRFSGGALYRADLLKRSSCKCTWEALDYKPHADARH